MRKPRLNECCSPWCTNWAGPHCACMLLSSSSNGTVLGARHTNVSSLLTSFSASVYGLDTAAEAAPPPGKKHSIAATPYLSSRDRCWRRQGECAQGAFPLSRHRTTMHSPCAPPLFIAHDQGPSFLYTPSQQARSRSWPSRRSLLLSRNRYQPLTAVGS